MSFCHTNIYMVITQPQTPFWGGQKRGGCFGVNFTSKKDITFGALFYHQKRGGQKGGGKFRPSQGGVWELSVFTSSAMRGFLLEVSELRGGPYSPLETLLL
jgi:hypothetical protein